MGLGHMMNGPPLPFHPSGYPACRISPELEYCAVHNMGPVTDSARSCMVLSLGFLTLPLPAPSAKSMLQSSSASHTPAAPAKQIPHSALLVARCPPVSALSATSAVPSVGFSKQAPALFRDRVLAMGQPPISPRRSLQSSTHLRFLFVNKKACRHEGTITVLVSRFSIDQYYQYIQYWSVYSVPVSCAGTRC